MGDLARLEEQLENLKELRELVGALRSMAASRSREAHEAFAGTRAYRAIVERAIFDLETVEPGTPPVRNHDGVMLVITSENGFVGNFNNRIVTQALEAKTAEEKLIIVGKRGQIVARERNVSPNSVYPMSSRIEGITRLAQQIGERLISVPKVRIVFAEYKSGASFDVINRPVLPLISARPNDRDKPFPPLHHLPVESLAESLSSEYLFAEICHSLMESLASENGARLQTMSSASRNIDKRLETLVRQARAAWQERTTSDLLEVVVGTEASNNP